MIWRKLRRDVVVRANALIKSGMKMPSPFPLNRTRPNQMQSKHPFQTLVRGDNDIINSKCCLRGVIHRIVRTRNRIRVK